MCYFLNFGYNHGRDCYRLLDAETGRVAHSRDVTWHHPEAPWIPTPIRAAPTEPPRDIYVPMPQSVPVAASSPAPVATPPAPAPAATLPPPPIRTSNSPAPIPPRVSRELEHEGYVEMPGRTRGETRALRDASRDYAHRYGIPLDHAAMVSILAKGEATNEIVRHHGASKDSPDLPTAHASDLPTPNNVSDVEKSPHADIWRHSMHQEFDDLLQAGTFAPAPAQQLVANVIDAKWVYTWKVDEHGWVVKAKSRLVARGFKQREGVDFSETFAPTVPSSCVRLLSAIACECDLDLYHFDVDQAFVQSDLEDVFLRLPKGCGDLSGKVVRLNKSLYGLEQASRTWQAHLTTCLKRLGFEQCMADVCVFSLIEDGRTAITAVAHVDDIFAVGQKERCDRLCVDLNRTIPAKNLRDLKWYGGCRY